MSTPPSTARANARFLLIFALMFACVVTAGTLYFKQPSAATPAPRSPGGPGSPTASFSSGSGGLVTDPAAGDPFATDEPTPGAPPEGSLPTNYDTPVPYPTDPAFTEGFPADSAYPRPLPEGIGGGTPSTSGAAGTSPSSGWGAVGGPSGVPIPEPYPGASSSPRTSSTFRPRQPQASGQEAPPAPEPTSTTPEGPTTTQGGITVGGSAEMARLINEARARVGSPAAEIDLSMWDSASACAVSNVRAGYLSHSLPGCQYENLAMWPAPRADAAGVVDMWVNSPGHARAMLDPKVTAITVAWASDGRSCVVAASFARAWNATS